MDVKNGRRIPNVIKNLDGTWSEINGSKLPKSVYSCFSAWRHVPDNPFVPTSDFRMISRRSPDRCPETEYRRIVCAANRCKNGVVLLGVRHGDNLMRAQAEANGGQEIMVGCEQGFIDNYRQFVSRSEGWKIAACAGQIMRFCGGESLDDGNLFSDNLY